MWLRRNSRAISLSSFYSKSPCRTQTKSPTYPGGWFFGCDTIPQSPGRPCIKEAEEPRASNGIKKFQNGASGAAALWQEWGHPKITDQSRGMNFWMWSHPLICQPSICKRSGQTRALTEATGCRHWVSILPNSSQFYSCLFMFFFMVNSFKKGPGLCQGPN